MIPHNRPTLGEEESSAALRAISSGWLAQGKEVELFENEVCSFLGLPEGHAVALTNGTSALYLALWALKAKGKKVAIPVYACSALRNAVAMAGATELLIDISPNTPNIDLGSLASTEADVAIIPHMFGLPVDFSTLKNTYVIEDCAQSLGASVNGQQVGLHGRIGIFSFYATKLITSGGQGGMLVSKDKEIVDAVRDYRQFDCRMDCNKRFNFQMTDLQAAIGREQLKKLPSFLDRRSQIYNSYKESGIELLDIAATDEKTIKPVRYRAVALTEYPQKMIASLFNAGVKVIVPIEDWELLGVGSLFPNSLALTKSTVSLPVYPSLTKLEIDIILKGVLSI